MMISIRHYLVNCLKVSRYKETNPNKWKYIFALEQIIRGNRNRKFIIRMFKVKIIKYIVLKMPSPYHLKGHIYSVKQWFEEPLPKEMNESEIKSVIPKSSISLKKPYYINGELNPAFIKDGKTISFSKQYLCCFKNARIINETGVIVSYDDKVFADLTFEFGKSIEDIEEYEIFKAYINKCQFKKGCLATITSTSVNYFHWVFDCLPRLKIIEDFGEEIDYLIVPYDLEKFHIETLNHLGYSENKLLRIKNKDHFLCDNLLVPSLPSITGYIPKWACNYLRNKFTPENISKPYRLIYISRKDAIYRKLVNEKEIENYLRKVGFEIIQMSEYSFLEQVKICAEAKIVVSPHGAGLSNTVFCQNAKIVELFSPSYVNVCFWRLSNAVNNEYHYILGQDTTGYSPDEWRDFQVDINELKHTLDLILIS